jgi:hypothetical protein
VEVTTKVLEKELKRQLDQGEYVEFGDSRTVIICRYRVSPAGGSSYSISSNGKVTGVYKTFRAFMNNLSKRLRELEEDI